MKNNKITMDDFYKMVGKTEKGIKNGNLDLICRWLNHSFMPFSKKQEELYKQVREKYNLICKVNLHVNN